MNVALFFHVLLLSIPCCLFPLLYLFSLVVDFSSHQFLEDSALLLEIILFGVFFHTEWKRQGSWSGSTSLFFIYCWCWWWWWYTALNDLFSKRWSLSSHRRMSSFPSCLSSSLLCILSFTEDKKWLNSSLFSRDSSLPSFDSHSNFCFYLLIMEIMERLSRLQLTNIRQEDDDDDVVVEIMWVSKEWFPLLIGRLRDIRVTSSWRW